jgi:hypothetical protein
VIQRPPADAPWRATTRPSVARILGVLSALVVVACGQVSPGGQPDANPTTSVAVIPSTATLPTEGSQGFIAVATSSSIAQIARARSELRILEVDAAAIGSTQASLREAKLLAAEHVRAVLAVEQFSLEADRTYLQALIDALTGVIG